MSTKTLHGYLKVSKVKINGMFYKYMRFPAPNTLLYRTLFRYILMVFIKAAISWSKVHYLEFFAFT